MKKIRHETNPRSEELRHLDVEERGLPYLSHRPARITIRARGQVFDRSVDFAKWLSMGVEAYRPTDDGLAEKFRINAERVLAPASADKAVDHLMALETLDDLSGLMGALAG